MGSPHTWPSLLAALTWLVELLNYQERAEQARQVRENLGAEVTLPVQWRWDAGLGQEGKRGF